jgi:hypothetical protein
MGALLPNSPAKTLEVLADFNRLALQFNAEHKDQSVATKVAIAYCNPLALSERVAKRNKEAKETNNPSNGRSGHRAFLQLAALVEVDPAADPTKCGSLSEQDIYEIGAKHPKPIFRHQSKTLSSLEGPTTSSQDKWKTLSTALLRTSRQKEAASVADMIKHVGFWQTKPVEDNVKVPLTLREGIKADVFIDTTTGDPATLAKQLVTELADASNAKSNFPL